MWRTNDVSELGIPCIYEVGSDIERSENELDPEAPPDAGQEDENEADRPAWLDVRADGRRRFDDDEEEEEGDVEFEEFDDDEGGVDDEEDDLEEDDDFDDDDDDDFDDDDLDDDED